MTPKQVAREIQGALRQAADPRRAEGIQKYFKEPIRALGVPTPVTKSLYSNIEKRLASQEN